jgi:hypothetical protein
VLAGLVSPFPLDDPDSSAWPIELNRSSMFVRSPPRGWFVFGTASGGTKTEVGGPEIDPGRQMDCRRAIHLEHAAR